MIKEAIGTGTTIDDAKQAALASLNAPETADIQFEVVDPGKKKTFGLFGGAPAKVRVWYEYQEPVKEKAAEKKAEKKTEKKPDKKAPKAAEKATATKAEAEAQPVEDAAPIEGAEEVVSYFLSLVKGMGLENTRATHQSNGNELAISVECDDDYGILIGRRGETLDALQYLTRLAANKICKQSIRVNINIGNYREKREKTLRELAAKSAERVLKYGRNVSLEPMNPYERRIIHTAVQAYEGVTSHSVGNDGERRVIISLKEGVQPTNPPKGGYRPNNHGNGRGYKGNGNRKPYAQKNASRTVEPREVREPRTDEGAQQVSRYGKIN